MTATHNVFNQASALVGYNLFGNDKVLKDGVQRAGASWADEQLTVFGALMGSEAVQLLAVQANENEPVLHTHDRFGHRIDQVDFHPSWHEMMRMSVEHRVHSLPWSDPRPGAHVARAAMMFMAYQTEAGHCCPISMTYSAVPALRRQSDLAAIWEPMIVSNQYDLRYRPAAQKTGIIMGMAMTEKQGGSDVRANTTRAVPVCKGGPGGEYLITGHKWFCSAPMSDAFLVLAKTEKGVSCFLVPRWLPDGTRNVFNIQRLKDKLGNRSNASSEVEFENTLGWLVGEEGRGVPTIIEMVNHTRLDCAIGSAALMRQATVQAVHHCSQREAFGKKLINQPLMKNVLADLAVESEAATRLMMRVARAYDQQGKSEGEAAFKRIASAIAKYWLCKRAPAHVVEALECHGGNGYVEASVMPRLFRESPLNSVWEGSGNVISLDVLRAIGKEPASVDALVAELAVVKGADGRLTRFINGTQRDLLAVRKPPTRNKTAHPELLEMRGRRLVEKLALALQAKLMVEEASSASAEAFIATRINGNGGICFGTLPEKTKFDDIVGGAHTLTK